MDAREIKIPSRSVGFDIARAIAFMAVVWGHMFSIYGTIFVYGFHLQLFYFISGWFFSSRKKFLPFIGKKARQLLLPYVVVGILISLLLGIREGNLSYQLYHYFWVGDTPIGPMWFFLTLFFGLVVLYICAKKPPCIVGLPIIVLLGFWLSAHVTLPFFILHGMIQSGLIGVGFLARTLFDFVMKKQGEKVKAAVWLPYVGMVITAGLWYLYAHRAIGAPFLYENLFPRGIVDYFAPFAAVLTILLFSCFILAKIPPLSACLSFLGRHTLLMICVHEFDIFLSIVNSITTPLIGHFAIDGFWMYAVQWAAKILFYGLMALLVDLAKRAVRREA